MIDQEIGTWHEVYSDDPDYRAEGMANDVAQQVAFKMDSLGITRSELAEALGVNRAYVSKVLNAPPNLTMKSIAAVAIALGIKAEPKVILDPSDWILIDRGLRSVLSADGYIINPLGLMDADQVTTGGDSTLAFEAEKRPANVVPFTAAHKDADSASNGAEDHQEMAGG